MTCRLSVYPNDALTEVCELIEDYDLNSEQLKNLVADIIGEIENRNEAAYEAYLDSASAQDDSTYRRQMIDAGRGHLLR